MSEASKLGVFDSGLGGLLIAKSIREALPDTDMLYFGDTLHVPYGNRSRDAIEYYTRRAMDAMFNKGCKLIITACNTASVACLRQLQQDYLPKHWPDRNILGVVVPTLEEAIDQNFTQLGMIATRFTAESKIYEEELQKINPDVSLHTVTTPLLVPLIENAGETWLEDVLKSYLSEFDLGKTQGLILGCTHYVRLKPLLKKILPEHVRILAQDEIVPPKLIDYLNRHSEYKRSIAQNGICEFYVSDLTATYQFNADMLYDQSLQIEVLST